MKLRILAVAIIAATVSATATADVSLGGMARVQYDNGSEQLKTAAELNLDASAAANGITYFGHAQMEGAGSLDGNKTGHDVTIDDIYVGMKGGFGEVRLGDTDNGCDATDVGGFPDEIYGDVATAGCAGGDQTNITYIGSAGAVSYAASFSPEKNQDNFSIGAKAKFGVATVSLGHTAGDGVADTTVLGLAGAFGPVSVGLRASDVDGASDNLIQVHGAYSSGANTFALGFADTGSANPVSGYWKRDLGAKTFFLLDVQDSDDNGDTDVALRLQKNF